MSRSRRRFQFSTNFKWKARKNYESGCHLTQLFNEIIQEIGSPSSKGIHFEATNCFLKKSAESHLNASEVFWLSMMSNILNDLIRCEWFHLFWTEIGTNALKTNKTQRKQSCAFITRNIKWSEKTMWNQSTYVDSTHHTVHDKSIQFFSCCCQWEGKNSKISAKFEGKSICACCVGAQKTSSTSEGDNQQWLSFFFHSDQDWLVGTTITVTRNKMEQVHQRLS